MAQIGKLGVKCIGIIGLIFLFSCSSEEKKTPKKPTAKKSERKAIKRPTFSSDSAYHFIETQVSFGPRVPNSEAHLKTAFYLENKLNSYGLEVSLQKAEVVAFDNTVLKIINIIGSYNPDSKKRIMLFAHWDTRPFADQDTKDRGKAIDGANDGGSGVGVLLEVARQLQLKKPDIGVDIFFFDAEDYGQPSDDMRKRKAGTWCLGSQYWANNPHITNYNADFGILLDMVGAKNAIFTREAWSMGYAPQIVNKVWGIANALGYGNHFNYQQTNHVGEDDHVYINKIAGIPSIDIIQYDPTTGNFAPHWHTHEDNMAIIDKRTLQAVGETILATVLNEVNQ